MSGDLTVINYLAGNNVTMVVDSRKLALEFIDETIGWEQHSDDESLNEFYEVEEWNTRIEGKVHSRLLELFEGYARRGHFNLLDSEDERELTETDPADDLMTREDDLFDRAWLTMQGERLENFSAGGLTA